MNNYVNTRLSRVSDFNNTIEISHHPDLTLDILKAFNHKAWGFHWLHNHPNFKFEWVLEFNDRYWDWNKLSECVDIDTISKNHTFPWNWIILTNRFSPKEILKYPHLPWDFVMFYVDEITEDHIPLFEEFQDVIPEWKWYHIAKHTRWTIFKKAVHLPWSLFISDIKLTSEEFVPEDVEILKDYEMLCNWIKLTIIVHIDIINENTYLPWNMEYIQWNKSTWKTPVQSIEKCIREWTAANTIKRYWKNAISNPSFRICTNRLKKEFKDLERECNRMSSATISFTKLRPDAIIPSKATERAIGLDLYSVEPYVVLPGQRVVVSTGLRVSLPDGTYGRIAPRAGLAVKHGLDVGAGVIDPDYEDEIRVVLFNHDSMHPFVIRPGWRIAQLIVENAVTALDVVSME
jgi:dUTP pyrophosphatase